jgi:hypothetical protein
MSSSKLIGMTSTHQHLLLKMTANKPERNRRSDVRESAGRCDCEAAGDVEWIGEIQYAPHGNPFTNPPRCPSLKNRPSTDIKNAVSPAAKTTHFR